MRSIVVIADIVSSRELTHRRRSQVRLQKLVDALNEDFHDVIAVPFGITLGDEFEGVLRDAAVIPDVIWRIETFYRDAPIRLGFGYGTVSTALSESPREMDGKAFHHARAAIQRARKQDLLGGVFEGFGADLDRVLNGFARLLHHHRNRLKPGQRKILTLRREGYAQVAIASRWRVTESAISQGVKGAGWQAFSEAEDGFRAALDLFKAKGRKR